MWRRIDQCVGEYSTDADLGGVQQWLYAEAGGFEPDRLFIGAIREHCRRSGAPCGGKSVCRHVGHVMPTFYCTGGQA